MRQLSMNRVWQLLALSLFVLIATTCWSAEQQVSAKGSAAPPVQREDQSKRAVAVELVQPVMEIPPDGQATALLVLRNTTDTTLQVHVKPVINAKVVLKSDPALDKPETILPKGEFAWNVNVAQKGEDQVSGSVIFRVEYSQVKGGRSVPQIAYTILQIASRDPVNVAEVKMESTLESLDQQHPGKVYLVVTNKSQLPIRVQKGNVSWQMPDFITITAEEPHAAGNSSAKGASPGSTVTLAPNAMDVIPFNVGTLARVQTGKHLLVATVPVEFEGVATRHRYITVSKEVQVGVVGESALLKLLAIPSFLVIPGFIALIIWDLLWKNRLFRPKHDAGSSPVAVAEEVLNPRFWVAAITISIPVMWLYMLTVNRDLLGNYGLSDLVYIWMLSVICVGVIGYILIIGGYRLHLRRITPSEEDGAMDVLRKLDRQGLGLFLKKVQFEGADQKVHSAFVLQKTEPDQESVWVGPTIELRWESGADQKLKDEVDYYRKAGDDDPGKMARCLAKADKSVTVDWKKPTQESTGIAKPRELPMSSIKHSEAYEVDCIIEVL